MVTGNALNVAFRTLDVANGTIETLNVVKATFTALGWGSR